MRPTMTDRAELIARKETVRRQIERARRDLLHEETRASPASRRVQQLQQQIEQLMAEEFNLRVAIDRSSVR